MFQGSLNVPLSTSDVIYAAIAAFCLTMIIRSFVRVHRIVKQTMQNAESELLTGKNDIKAVLERCYKIFPVERFSFHGQIFTRGMKIKITTLQDKIFEGELVGFNSKNMICIMTSKLIIAHELCNIREIVMLEEA